MSEELKKIVEYTILEEHSTHVQNIVKKVMAKTRANPQIVLQLVNEIFGVQVVNVKPNNYDTFEKELKGE